MASTREGEGRVIVRGLLPAKPVAQQWKGRKYCGGRGGEVAGFLLHNLSYSKGEDQVGG